PENQPSDPNYTKVLKKYFGYSKFRPLQWKIINSVLNDKKDNCVVMATGYGKSLCYQFPSVYTQRLTVVISPLISLMEDQVLGLKAANIPACLLGSAQEDNSLTRSNLLRGEYRLLYITPEFASSASSLLSQLHQKIGIDLIAIDEAHCVSQWGHDFRAAYRSLGCLKEEFSTVPVMALTATATVEVRRDICRSLKLHSPIISCTGFDRPNLFLSVSNKTTAAVDLKGLLHQTRNGLHCPTIVYCPTKKTTMEVANTLAVLGFSCLPYHAGLSLNTRKQAHKKFVNDQVQIVVATVAFGMGIDKPDVRKVIHYGAPKDIESYYQEVGRAGRDGLPSDCHAFYSDSDFAVSRHFINEIKSEKFREHKTLMMNKMMQYLASASCRRRILLSHFEGQERLDVGGTENCCDNCRKKIESSRRQNYYSNKNWQTADTMVPQDQLVDLSREALDLFSAIKLTEGRFGLMVPIQFLCGAHSQKLQRMHKLVRHQNFGSGKYRPQKFWKALGQCLKFEGYLKEQAVDRGFGATVHLSKKAEQWLKKAESSRSLKLVPTQDLLSELRAAAVKQAIQSGNGPRLRPDNITPRKPVPATLTAPSPAASTTSPPTPAAVTPEPEVDPVEAKLQMELYVKLVKQRNDISQETGFTPHNIASNKVLLDLARFRPSNCENLQRIEDLPAAKAERFGQMFVDTIQEFCGQHGLSVDQFPTLSSFSSSSGMQQQLAQLTGTQQASYLMFTQESKSLEEIASLRGLKTGTIATHLCEALRQGLTVDIRKVGVTPAREELIASTIQSPPINCVIGSLTRIKEQLPVDVEFNHIKVVIASLVGRYGQTTDSAGNLVLNAPVSVPSDDVIIVESDVDGQTTGPTNSANLEGCSRSQTHSNGQEQATSDKELASFTHQTSPPQRCPLSKMKSEPPVETNQRTFQFKSSSASPPSLSSSQSLPMSQSMSQTADQNLKRKLPDWMATNPSKQTFTKKIKANKLFR
ncbi:hypothetical protein BaRGS_00038018, partial [Batillaria attramentaria]